VVLSDNRVKLVMGRNVRMIVALSLVALSFFINPQSGYAAALTAASVTLSDSRPSQASVTYTIGFTFPGTTAISCIEAKFTTTATGSTVPTAMTTTSAAKGTMSGGGLTSASWVTTDVATNGTVRLKHATTEASTATAFSLGWTTITNTSTAGTFFAQITTYTASGACTTALDTVTVALTTTAAVTVSATVDPSLTFTVAGIAASTAYKGALTTSAGCVDTATAVTFPSAMSTSTNYECAQSLTTSTNGVGGYTVTARGTVAGDDLVSGANTITDHTGTNASPAAFGAATEAFGYTTNDGVLGTGTTTRFSADDTFAGLTNSALEVAYSATAVSAQAINVGYKIRFGGVTESGTYTGTVIYVATPVF